jgi:hypothetical protein
MFASVSKYDVKYWGDRLFQVFENAKEEKK